ncbi:helix-turn-helix domain-containing protein [Dyadobacter sp. 676]|uniref:Helix-turn-helix domain-containing protein n=1 Tax=Dyadobacter sp. 676 TaxID=3088362 RepID=A0AAU8FM28_9BACT
MQHQEFEPPEALQDAIKCFWYDDRDLGKAQTAFRVIPDGYAEIIFHFGSELHISSDTNLYPLPSPFMVGLLDRPAVFSSRNRLEIIGIRCFPWAVFDLLGLPAGKDGVRVFEHPVARLHSNLEKLVGTGKIHEAVSQVEQYFTDLRSRVTVDGMLSKAGTAMRQTNGTLPVSRVAAAAHATVRTLERNFKQSSGHTVKDVSALMRFEQVRNRLWHDPDSGIAALAYELGYADQSHLSREFKRYTGTTPAAFARNARKARLALNQDFVAFVQA